MSLKDVRAKIERLRSRLSAAEAGVKDTSTALAAAEIEGREANGKLASLQALLFRKDVLAKEVERLERVELPGAELAEAKKERDRQIALARRIHRNRLIPAEELDAALAAAESAWLRYVASNDNYFATLRAAGAMRRNHVLGGNILQRAGWSSMPTLMRLLDAPVTLRRHALRLRDAEATLHSPDAPAGDGDAKHSEQEQEQEAGVQQ